MKDAVDKILYKLQEIVVLREERGYTREKFYALTRKINPLLDHFPFTDKDKLWKYLEKKEQFFSYKKLKKEIGLMEDVFVLITRNLPKQYRMNKHLMKQLQLAYHRIKDYEPKNKECLKKWKAVKSEFKDTNPKDMKDAFHHFEICQEHLMEFDDLEDRMLNRAVSVVEKEKSNKAQGVGKRVSVIAVAIMTLITASATDMHIYGFKPNTVLAGQQQNFNDVLQDVRNFVKVNKKNYEEVIAESDKAIFVFYNNVRDSSGANRNIARVLNEVLPKYPEVKLILYDKDSENLPVDKYKEMGFPCTPFSMAIKEGEVTFRKRGGPNNVMVKLWIKALPKIIKDKL